MPPLEAPTAKDITEGAKQGIDRTCQVPNMSDAENSKLVREVAANRYSSDPNVQKVFGELEIYDSSDGGRRVRLTPHGEQQCKAEVDRGKAEQQAQKDGTLGPQQFAETKGRLQDAGRDNHDPGDAAKEFNKLSPKQREQMAKDIEAHGKDYPNLYILRDANGKPSLENVRTPETKEHKEFVEKTLTPMVEQIRQQNMEKDATQRVRNIETLAPKALDTPILPLPQNVPAEKAADKAMGELHQQVAAIRNLPEAEQKIVLEKLKNDGVQVTYDENGKPAELIFRGSGNKETISLTKSFEQMQKDAERDFDEVTKRAQQTAGTEAAATNRKALKDSGALPENMKKWFERTAPQPVDY